MPKPHKRRDAADSGTSAPSARRMDRVESLLGKPYRRKDGTLLCEAIVGKPGVLTYRDADGHEWRELVPASTLEDPDYLGALGQAVVTLGHPDEDVTPDNVQALSVGNTDGTLDLLEGHYIKVRLALRERKALDAVAAGTVELSPGYDVWLDQRAGIDPVHGRYDAIQTKRRLNHIAIVDKGRSGPDVRLRADSALQVLPTQEDKMLTIEDIKKALEPVTQRLDAVEAELKKKPAEPPKNPQEPAPQDKAAAEAEAKKKLDAAIEKGAAERAELLVAAKAHGVEVKPETGNVELRRAIATKIKPDLRKDASDDYCQAIIDQAGEVTRLDAEDDPYRSFSELEQPEGLPTGRKDREELRPIDVLRKSHGWA